MKSNYSMENNPGDIGKMPVRLPNAKQLRAEIETKKKADADNAYNKKIEELTKTILEKKNEGTLTVLSLSERVVNTLLEAGYKVTFNRAANSGDMDSHTITW